jgi:hypothetical protein
MVHELKDANMTMMIVFFMVAPPFNRKVCRAKHAQPATQPQGPIASQARDHLAIGRTEVARGAAGSCKPPPVTIHFETGGGGRFGRGGTKAPALANFAAAPSGPDWSSRAAETTGSKASDSKECKTIRDFIRQVVQVKVCSVATAFWSDLV